MEEQAHVGDVVQHVGHDDGTQAVGMKRQALTVQHKLDPRAVKNLGAEHPGSIKIFEEAWPRAKLQNRAGYFGQIDSDQAVPVLVDLA